jgi:hypothetical protein
MSVDSLKVQSMPQQRSHVSLTAHTQRTVDGDDLWPPQPDDCWAHCGSALGLFGLLTRFNTPLAARWPFAL